MTELPGGRNNTHAGPDDLGVQYNSLKLSTMPDLSAGALPLGLIAHTLQSGYGCRRGYRLVLGSRRTARGHASAARICQRI